MMYSYNVILNVVCTFYFGFLYLHSHVNFFEVLFFLASTLHLVKEI
jgi:hypothetical protein